MGRITDPQQMPTELYDMTSRFVGCARTAVLAAKPNLALLRSGVSISPKLE